MGLRQTLPILPHVSPDIPVASVPRELHAIVDLLFIGHLPEERMPQDMRKPLYAAPAGDERWPAGLCISG
jgi:hypothetical protein